MKRTWLSIVVPLFVTLSLLALAVACTSDAEESPCSGDCPAGWLCRSIPNPAFTEPVPSCVPDRLANCLDGGTSFDDCVLTFGGDDLADPGVELDLGDRANDTGERPEAGPEGDDHRGGCDPGAAPCLGNGDCGPEEYCGGGCCARRPLEDTCTGQNQPCTGSEWGTEVFFCDLDRGLCLERCDTFSQAGRADECPAGAWCVELSEPSSGFDGVCVPGDCNDACFDPASCPDDAAFSCDDGVGTCYAVGNEASFCVGSGNVAVGGACRNGRDDPSATCRSGLFCLANRCVEPCALDGAPTACPGEERCVQAFDQTGDNRPGVCGTPCPPFSQGECPADQLCEVAVGSASNDLVGFVCLDSPTDADGELVPVVDFGEPCDAEPSDGLDDRCREGGRCWADSSGDAGGRCRQFCDTTMEIVDDVSSCPSELVCVPLAVEGIGGCFDPCDPYLDGRPYSSATGAPRERWLDNGCPHTDETHYACHPFVTAGDQSTPIELPGPPDLAGYCQPRPVPDGGFGWFGADCAEAGDVICNPDSFCLDIGSRDACVKLCRPYSGAAHSDCNYRLGEDGTLDDVVDVCLPSTSQHIGYCFAPALADRVEGDSCTAFQAGQLCRTDDTFCLAVPGDGYRCARLCKKGVASTCPPLAGSAQPRWCREDVAFQPPIPEYVGICDTAF